MLLNSPFCREKQSSTNFHVIRFLVDRARARARSLVRRQSVNTSLSILFGTVILFTSDHSSETLGRRSASSRRLDLNSRGTGPERLPAFLSIVPDKPIHDQSPCSLACTLYSRLRVEPWQRISGIYRIYVPRGSVHPSASQSVNLTKMESR